MKTQAVALIRKVQSLSPFARVRVGLILVAAFLAVVLLLAKKPWDVRPHGEMKISDYVAKFVWIALLVDLGLVAILAATARWWTAPLAGKSVERRLERRTPQWFWPLVIAAMALNTFLCAPRLSQSFWHDETYPIRNAIVGVYKKQSDGSLKLRPTNWVETLFFYKKPNHTLYSGLARLGNDVWRALTRPRGLQFNEVVIRLPAFLAGIGSVATIALLLNYLRFPSAGVVAAFLTALHPWHIRYASEARAYAFVLLLVPVVLYYFLRAVEDGRWRWWLAFGASQFLLLYFYPTCVYVLVVLNLCAPLAIWWTWKRDSLVPGLRWVVANLGAALLFLPVMLPCVPQFLEYVKGTGGQGQLSLMWLANFLAHMVAGIPWAYQGHYEPGSIELYPWYVGHPGLGVLVGFLCMLFLVMGIRRLIARGRLYALLPVILLAPAVFCYWDTSRRGGFIYEWYLLFLLPGALALWGLGLDEFWSSARSRTAKIAAGVFVVLVLGDYVWWTTPQRDFLMTHSIQPNQESVLLTRPTLNPHDPRQKDIITTTFYGAPEPYDPNIIMVRNASELGELVHRADAEGKTLFVNLGYLTTVEGEHFHKYELLKSSGFFEEVALLPGFEPTMHSRHVFKYKPGSAASFNFAAVPPDRGRPGTGYSY